MTRKMRVPAPRYYKLDAENHVVPCGLMEWADMFEDFAQRQLFETLIDNPEPWLAIDIKRHIEANARRIEHGLSSWQEIPTLAARQIRISTIFLGLDHGWMEGPPVVFESMVFNGPINEAMDRYSSYDDAAMGHEALVKRVREALDLSTGATVEDPTREKGMTDGSDSKSR